MDCEREEDRDRVGQPGFRPDPNLLKRSILADKPRVTRFPIDFDSSANPSLTNEGTGMMVGRPCPSRCRPLPCLGLSQPLFLKPFLQVDGVESGQETQMMM